MREGTIDVKTAAGVMTTQTFDLEPGRRAGMFFVMDHHVVKFFVQPSDVPLQFGFVGRRPVESLRVGRDTVTNAGDQIHVQRFLALDPGAVLPDYVAHG